MSASLPPRETLTVEFKSDLKKLSDRELIESLVCLANTEGGELWLGVEDDVTPKLWSVMGRYGWNRMQLIR